MNQNEKEIHLSNREKDVLKLLVKGLNYREIADELFISKYTSREYIARVYVKLEVNNRANCVTKAISIGYWI